MDILFFVLQAVVILLIARILDSIRGQWDAISEIRVWLRRLDEDLDSHDRLEVERFQRIEDPADPPETVCGYPLQELVLFAQACRQNGVENQDLVSFAHDVVMIRDMVQRDLQEAAEKALATGRIRCLECAHYGEDIFDRGGFCKLHSYDCDDEDFCSHAIRKGDKTE